MICYWVGESFDNIPLKLSSYLSGKFEISDCGNDFSPITQNNVTFAIFCLKKENVSIFSICVSVCKNLDIKLITLLSDDEKPSKDQDTIIYNQIDIRENDAIDKLDKTLKQLFEKPEINTTLTLETIIKHFPDESGSRIDIYRISNFIDNNLDKNLREEELAKICNYSIPYFSKIFRKTIGISFRDYVTNKRISKAKRLLTEDQNEKTASIAYQCGYNDLSYFSRIFKKKTGMTPTEYRKQY